MTNIASLADRAVILDNDIKAMTKEFAAVKDELKTFGVGSYEGDIGVATVRQNADSEVFDAKAAVEYLIAQGHISPQLQAAITKKFTVTKAGPMVVTTKAKIVKVIA
jgi:hypothetical protein